MSSTRFLLSLFAATLLLAQPAPAQEFEAVDDGPEIVRDADALRDMIRDRPVHDPDTIETVLLFTNVGKKTAVKCVAFNRNGKAVGRAWIRVPRLGLRYILADDLTPRDLIGHVQCGTDGHVIGSALLLAGGVTDLPVQQKHWDGTSRIRFPIVVNH